MASGNEVHIDELPPELRESANLSSENDDWESRFRQWVEANLLQGETRLLKALKQSGGRRQDAAKLLGWGRNTLTRKIKSLGLNV